MSRTGTSVFNFTIRNTEVQVRDPAQIMEVQQAEGPAQNIEVQARIRSINVIYLCEVRNTE